MIYHAITIHYMSLKIYLFNPLEDNNVSTLNI